MIEQPLPPGRTADPPPVCTLVLAPHFDDEVIGCGGLIRKLTRAGAEVRVLFLTDGSGGIEEIEDRIAYSARRRREAKEAVAILGCAGFEVLEIRDGSLAETRAEAAAGIRRALLALRPGLVLVPSPLEVSADHRGAFGALHDALSKRPVDPPLADLSRGLEIWLYEVNHPGYPDRLVDVSAEVGTLELAMAAYASQEERHPYLRVALGLRQFRTLTLGPDVALAEGFRRMSALELASRPLAALVGDLGGSVARLQVPEQHGSPETSVAAHDVERLAEDLRRTYAEIVRLNELMHEMQGTRAWRLHRFVERWRARLGRRSERGE